MECQTDLSGATEYELNKDVFRLTAEIEELQSKHKERVLSDKIKGLKMANRHTITKLCYLFNDTKNAFDDV